MKLQTTGDIRDRLPPIKSVKADKHRRTLLNQTNQVSTMKINVSIKQSSSIEHIKRAF